MKRIYVLFSSLLFLASSLTADVTDTLESRKTLIFGVELTGPVIYSFDGNNQNYEGYVALKLNHKYYLVSEAGFSNYKYEQYNYRSENSGMFIRLGADINLLKDENKTGDHFVGIGIRYGLSIFNQEIPWFKYENYWGTVESAILDRALNGHFLQLSGGIKAELFENIFIGWTIRANLMIYQSSGKGNKPVYIPGMGGTDGTIQPGVSFHLAWQIPLSR